MSGDEAAVLRLWEQKTGRRPSEDLSDVLPVVMGSFTEPLNVAWFVKQTGLCVATEDPCLNHPIDTWRTATLDGMVRSAQTGEPLGIFEAKHVNAFGRPDETLAKYQPQLHHNAAVAGLDRAYLSVFRGNADWVYFEVEIDPTYAAAVRQAEWRFWMAVQADEPPTPYAAPPPPAADALRVVEMTGNNEWAACAADWLANRDAAKTFEKAAKDLKAHVEPDVKLAFGHGIEISRSKAGALSIKERKA
jgi:predicted phage-related endonuclease